MAAGLLYLVTIVYFIALTSAEPSHLPAFFYPVEHRSNLKEVQEANKVSLDGYDLQIIPNEQFDVAQFDPASVSFTDIIWEFIPSPLALLKGLCHKLWKIIKFTIPIDLVLLGMALVVGFCAFTPYCTLIIEKPFAVKLKSFTEGIPYIDEVETLFYRAYDTIQELQM